MEAEISWLRKNLTGKIFGRWTVLRYGGKAGLQSVWVCRCECGKVKERVLYGALVNGKSQSCGCLRSEVMSKVNTKHGRSQSTLYHMWQQMKDRCYNVSRKTWKRYGGRGIEVAPRWLESFENFAADILREIGERPYKMVLDRKDNDGNYEPGNVRWADYFLSARNTSRNVWFDWKGERRTLTDIAAMEKVAYCSFRNKVRIMGMTPEDAVADCRARGLVFKEKAKGKRPALAVEQISTTVAA
jgi:hypothetical protein